MKFSYVRPESVGISPHTINRFLDSCEKEIHSLYSFAVVKGTEIASLGFYKPMEPDMVKMWHSISKSINSLAVGVAMGDGKLSLDDKPVDFFPDDLPDKYDPRLGRVTVRDLLMMASNSAFTSSSFINVPYSWRRRYFELTPYDEPGQWFAYDTGAAYMLSCMVKKATGKNSLDLLKERVFTPLGINQADWLQDKDGNCNGGWGFYSTVIDMLKLARLILNYGKWDGVQLIPEWYMREATKKQIETYRNPGPDGWPYGYGYQFWRYPENCFGCYGAFGQLIVCCPEKDLFVVTSSGCEYEQENPRLLRIITETIIAESHNNPIPADDNTYEALKTRIDNLTLPTAEGAANSVCEKDVFGKKYIFSENDSNITEVSFERIDGKTISIRLIYNNTEITVKAGYRESITEDGLPLDTPLHTIHSFSYGWNSEGKLQVKQYLCNTSYFKLYEFDFTDDRCRFSQEKNVSLYAEQPVVAEGVCKA